MGMYDANSDRDYYDEAHGPYHERVERECAVCHETFKMEVEGEYVMHPACPKCVNLQQERNARHVEETQREPPILKSRGAA